MAAFDKSARVLHHNFNERTLLHALPLWWHAGNSKNGPSSVGLRVSSCNRTCSEWTTGQNGYLFQLFMASAHAVQCANLKVAVQYSTRLCFTGLCCALRALASSVCGPWKDKDNGKSSRVRSDRPHLDLNTGPSSCVGPHASFVERIAHATNNRRRKKRVVAWMVGRIPYFHWTTRRTDNMVPGRISKAYGDVSAQRPSISFPRLSQSGATLFFLFFCVTLWIGFGF